MAQLEQRNQSLESQVAERTRELSWVNQQLQRQQDLLARWGGDEFVIVLPQASLGEALEVAARLRQAMVQVEPVGDCRLTMSYGVVQWQEGEDQHALLARADTALYRAKGNGKNAIAQ